VENPKEDRSQTAMLLEIYDEMQRASESGQAYRTRVTPGPADPAVAHPARVKVEVRGD